LESRSWVVESGCWANAVPARQTRPTVRSIDLAAARALGRWTVASFPNKLAFLPGEVVTHVTRPDGGQLAMGNSVACVMPVIQVACSGVSMTPSDVDRPEREWRGEERKHIKHAVPWTAILSAKVTVAHLVLDRHRQHRYEHG